jgi:hypothetical protein
VLDSRPVQVEGLAVNGANGQNFSETAQKITVI